jgi:TonB family protein
MLARSLVLLLLLGGTALAEDVQQTAEGMLDRARQLSDIRSPNAPGFRLNVTFSFIDQDLETVQGTYTEVWISNSQWRRETVVGNLRRVEIGGPTRHWLIDDGKDLPEEAARISTVVEIFPSRTVKFEFDYSTSPDSTTQCFVTKEAGEKHLRHAFCFDRDHHVLAENESPELIGDRVSDHACSYNQFSKFGDYWYPRQMECRQNGHREMEAKVVELALATSADPSLFMPPASALEMGNCPVSPVPPKAVSTPGPFPPAGMRNRQALVGLWMIVDTKGKPQGLRVTRASGKPFDDSALSAVRGWRFKPGTCNGEPIPLPLKVQVSFRVYR